jgi:hypothetical protein
MLCVLKYHGGNWGIRLPTYHPFGTKTPDQWFIVVAAIHKPYYINIFAMAQPTRE